MHCKCWCVSGINIPHTQTQAAMTWRGGETEAKMVSTSSVIIITIIVRVAFVAASAAVVVIFCIVHVHNASRRKYKNKSCVIWFDTFNFRSTNAEMEMNSIRGTMQSEINEANTHTHETFAGEFCQTEERVFILRNEMNGWAYACVFSAINSIRHDILGTLSSSCLFGCHSSDVFLYASDVRMRAKGTAQCMWMIGNQIPQCHFSVCASGKSNMSAEITTTTTQFYYLFGKSEHRQAETNPKNRKNESNANTQHDNVLLCVWVEWETNGKKQLRSPFGE